MDEMIYIGYNFGRFQNDQGNMQDYCNVFMIAEHAGQESADYHFGGQKCLKVKCASPEVFKDIQPGTRVQCFFNVHRQISYMVPAKKQ